MAPITKLSERPISEIIGDALLLLEDLPVEDAIARISQLPIDDVLDRLSAVQLQDTVSHLAGQAADSLSRVVDTASDLTPDLGSRSSCCDRRKLVVAGVTVGVVVGAIVIWRRRSASEPTSPSSTEAS